MSAQENQVALPLRNHTILACAKAIGEDFGFNPIFLRVPLAAMVIVSPTGRSAPISRSARSCCCRACCSRRQAQRRSVRRRPQRRRTSRTSWRKRLSSRRGLRRALRADRTARGAGAAIARRRKAKRALARRRVGAKRSITSITDASSGSDGAGHSSPARAAARSSRRRIGHQSPTSAVAAPSAQPLRSDIARVSSACRAATRLASVSAAPGVLGSGPTAEVSRTRYSRSRSNASLKRGRARARVALGAALKRDFDEAGIAAVKAAQQVHRVGEIAAACGPDASSSAFRCGWRAHPSPATRASCASATLTGFRLDGPVDRHSYPSFEFAEGEAYPGGPNARA
jgi:hypothetical protein